jgi:hypothetical protein
MKKISIKLKFNSKKIIGLAYKRRFVLFTALFATLLLIAFNVCYNEAYLKISILEAETGDQNNYIGIRKSKLSKVINKIEEKENNIKNGIAKEYQSPFDVVKGGEDDNSDKNSDLEISPTLR